nr:transcriptional regulator [Propionicimonas sp.]
MSDTTARALSLLNLLQVHRHWPGAELAERLGVTERTVRRDVERLRDLGYRIESTPGVAGGYRLRAGSAVPPLLLTDDEAVAIAIGLRLAATQRLVGGAETTLTALAKLEQVLPRALRERVNALAATVRPASIGADSGASPEVLGELALTCRDSERVRFRYTAADGAVTDRHVEPHLLVPSERHWYLLCWDLDRADWRKFRVDRLEDVRTTGARFTPRPLPEGDDEAGPLGWDRPTVQGEVVMDLALPAMLAHFGQWGRGAEADGTDRTRWRIAGPDVRDLMHAMSWVPAGVAYTADLPEAARTELAEITGRMARALSVPPRRPRRPAPPAR